MRRNFRDIDRQALLADISGADWSSVDRHADIDAKVRAFNGILLAIFDTHAPLKPTRVKHFPAPWLTPEIKLHMAKRDRARLKFRQDPSDDYHLRYISLRNRCNKICREARRRYIHKSIEECPPSKLWKFLKSLGVGKSQQCTSSFLDIDAINKHFSASPVTLDPSIKQSTLSLLASTSHLDLPPFDLSSISPQETLAFLKSVKTKAVGEDSLSVDMLMLVADFISPILSNIINYSFSTGTFPASWKYAHVIPLPKIANPVSFSQYRPISILPVLSKIIEHFVNRRLLSHLNRHALLNPYQSGFRPGHSTVTTLVKVTDDIRLNIECKKLTVLVLLDFSSAFNTVDFDILLGILNSINISQTSLSWFRDYLFGRRQRVRFNDMLSSWCELTAGVPQGGVLSPLLFSVFINSITESLTSSYHLYADDLQIYAAASVDDLPLLISQVNSDLESIRSWAFKFGLKVNAKKSQAIVIGSPFFIKRLSDVVVPDILFDGISIPFSSTVRNLGITIDQTLSWSPHIAEVSKNIFGSLHSLRRLQNFLPLHTKLTLTQSLLLPLLDYGDIAFLDLKEELLDKLERLQNVCIRYIFGLRKYDHISEFRSQLRWLPIRRRRDVHVLSLLFNLLFNPASPPYLSERFSYMADGSGHRLRSSANLTLAVRSNKTRTYSRSFTVRAVKLWNELPLSLRQSQSVASLKSNLKKFWLSNDLCIG
jgi:hypothetical protein